MHTLAKRSFPSFYQSYAPKLLEFYSLWLEWTEKEGNAQYIINHLSSEQDIDESIEAYKTHLKDKLLNDFPEKMVIDLKLLLKNVLFLYRAKSSKKAYDFLFRVLFNSPATLWYPRENILKTSDGRWYVPCYISIEQALDENEFPVYTYNDEILYDTDGDTIDNDWLLRNCHYWRITGDTSKSVSYIESPVNWAGNVNVRNDDGEVIVHDLAELSDGFGNVFGQSGISITSTSQWFYPGETLTITNPDTGEELPYHPVVQWYAEGKGYYTSNKGFLSDINKVQDNHYYQNYSYVVRSYVGMRYWRDIVKKLLHPAGLEFFSEVNLTGELEDGNGIYYYKDIDGRYKKPEETYIDFIRKFIVLYNHIIEYGKTYYDEDGDLAVGTYDEDNNLLPPDSLFSFIEGFIEDTETYSPKEYPKKYSKTFLKDYKLAQTHSEITDKFLSENMLPLWYPNDFTLKDLTPYINRNSVLLFRDLGTLIDPDITDWKELKFTESIDEPFYYKNELVTTYNTSRIYGVTLRPEYDVISGTISSNEYEAGETFIPDNYLVFISSSKEMNTSRVGTLTIGNNYLNYNTDNEDIPSDKTVAETITDYLSKKFGLNEQSTTRWGDLVTTDFIYISADSNRVFNEYSMVKIPDEYVTTEVTTKVTDEGNKTIYKYIFNKNAYLDEKIRIYNYADDDFSYRVFIERNNFDVTISFTFFGNKIPASIDENTILNTTLKYIGNQRLKLISKKYSKLANKAVITYKFKSDIQISTFDIVFPEYIDNSRIMLFTNGLLSTNIDSNHSNNKTTLSIDTIENENIEYESSYTKLGCLTQLDEISITETNLKQLRDFTLTDFALLENKKAEFMNVTLKSELAYILGTNIKTQVSYAELYVLSQIEAPTPRILSYPYYKDSYFTYDNVRLMPFMPHYSNVKKHSVAEINPDKESIKPWKFDKISWFGIYNLEARHTNHTLIKKTNPAQSHSELLDMVLNRFEYQNLTPKINTQEFTFEQSLEKFIERYTGYMNTGTIREIAKNYDILATANYSSTLVFDSKGKKINSNSIDWSNKLINISSDKLYSVPLMATKVKEHYVQPGNVVPRNVIQSCPEYFKPTNAMIFIDGIKVLDTDITYNVSEYQYIIDEKYFDGQEKDIEIYDFGNNFLLEKLEGEQRIKQRITIEKAI